MALVSATMTRVTRSTARAAADLAGGLIIASVEVEAAPERVFEALASNEVTGWWIRPGFFDTREWSGDVRVGGRWQASGVGNGRPYVLEGEFLEIDRPRKLVHTWRAVVHPSVKRPSNTSWNPSSRARASRCATRVSRRARCASPPASAGRPASIGLRNPWRRNRRRDHA